MKEVSLLYEGKAKKLWSGENSDILIVEYNDGGAAFNGPKKGTIIGKGAVNNKVSNHLFNFLEKSGIPTHFIEELSDRKTAVKKAGIIPVEVVVSNIAAGGLSKRLGIREGARLKNTVLEYFLKKGAPGDTLINDYHVFAMDLAAKEELDRIAKYSLMINKLLSEYLLPLKLELIDFRLEFGRFDGRIILADEISLDTCRFLDLRTGKPLDTDRFRRDLGEVDGEYGEVLQRLMNG